MIFPYPALHKGLRIFECRRSGRVWYEAESISGKRVPITEQVCQLLVHLKYGHINPYTLPEMADFTEAEADRLLLQLVDLGLLKKHRWVGRHEGPLFLVSLLPFRLRRAIPVCWATLFLLLALPVAFILSLYMLRGRFLMCSTGLLPEWACIALSIGILLIGCLLHELGHGFTTTAMRGRTSEIGLLTFLCLPVGFYLSYQKPTHCSRFAKFAIGVSGVSMNALTALVCLLLCGHTGVLDEALLLGAISNLLLVVFNLLPVPILDGGMVLEAITGLSDIGTGLIDFFLFSDERHAVMRRPFVFCIYLISGIGHVIALAWTLFSVICLFL